MKVEICEPYYPNDKCGGCLQCMMEQADYIAGQQTERAYKAEKALSESQANLERMWSPSAELQGQLEQAKKREQELVTKCIEKDSLYQALLHLTSAYKELNELTFSKIESLVLFNNSMARELTDIVGVTGKDLVARGWKSKEYENGLALKKKLEDIDAQIKEIQKCL